MLFKSHSILSMMLCLILTQNIISQPTPTKESQLVIDQDESGNFTLDVTSLENNPKDAILEEQGHLGIVIQEESVKPNITEEKGNHGEDGKDGKVHVFSLNTSNENDADDVIIEKNQVDKEIPVEIITQDTSKGGSENSQTVFEFKIVPTETDATSSDGKEVSSSSSTTPKIDKTQDFSNAIESKIKSSFSISSSLEKDLNLTDKLQKELEEFANNPDFQISFGDVDKSKKETVIFDNSDDDKEDKSDDKEIVGFKEPNVIGGGMFSISFGNDEDELDLPEIQNTDDGEELIEVVQDQKDEIHKEGKKDKVQASKLESKVEDKIQKEEKVEEKKKEVIIEKPAVKTEKVESQKIEVKVAKTDEKKDDKKDDDKKEEKKEELSKENVISVNEVKEKPMVIVEDKSTTEEKIIKEDVLPEKEKEIEIKPTKEKESNDIKKEDINEDKSVVNEIIQIIDEASDNIEDLSSEEVVKEIEKVEEIVDNNDKETVDITFENIDPIESKKASDEEKTDKKEDMEKVIEIKKTDVNENNNKEEDKSDVVELVENKVVLEIESPIVEVKSDNKKEDVEVKMDEKKDEKEEKKDDIEEKKVEKEEKKVEKEEKKIIKEEKKVNKEEKKEETKPKKNIIETKVDNKNDEKIEIKVDESKSKEDIEFVEIKSEKTEEPIKIDNIDKSKDTPKDEIKKEKVKIPTEKPDQEVSISKTDTPKSEKKDQKTELLDNITKKENINDLPENVEFSSKPIVSPEFKPKVANDHLLQHHLSLFNNFGLNIGFNIPKMDIEDEKKIKDEATKNFLKACQGDSTSQSSSTSLDCIKRLQEMKQSKKTPVLEANNSVKADTYMLKQTITSLGKGESANQGSQQSSTKTSVENRNKNKKVKIEGVSNLDKENVIQARTVSLGENQNEEKLLSLTNVRGDDEAKSEIESEGKLTDDKNMSNPINLNMNVKNEGKGENADSFSIIGNKLGGSLGQDLIVVPPSINSILIQRGNKIFFGVNYF